MRAETVVDATSVAVGTLIPRIVHEIISNPTGNDRTMVTRLEPPWGELDVRCDF
jgi:hypothetical protein